MPGVLANIFFLFLKSSLGKALQRLPTEDRKSVENPGEVETAPGNDDLSAGHSPGEVRSRLAGMGSHPSLTLPLPQPSAFKGVLAYTTLLPKLQNPGEEGEEGLTFVACEGPEVKAPGQEVCAPSSV